jgi:hypothetical protein
MSPAPPIARACARGFVVLAPFTSQPMEGREAGPLCRTIIFGADNTVKPRALPTQVC